MRKFTKSLLTLALLVLAVGGANSKTLSVNLSALPATSENTTWSWDSGTSTGTFAWSGQSYNSTELFGSGDYSTYTTLKLETATGTADHFRIILKFSNGADQVTINPVSTGSQSITLTDYTTAANLANVQTIRLSGANDVTGDITVTSIYLEGPDVVYIQATEIISAPAGTTDVKELTGYSDNSVWTNSVTYPKEFAVQGQAFGNGDGSNESEHVDISGYDWICFNVTTATANTAGLRVWIWDDVNSAVVTLYAYPIADYSTATYTTAAKIASTGTYVVRITGYKYLKGVKAANDWGSSASKVSMAYVSAGEAPVEFVPSNSYTLVGEVTGSGTLSAALADKNAVFFDATGVTGTDVDLTPTGNPNALFKANAGVLANTKNVIVSDVCANLELTDGYPFKAPAAFTATNAKFTKSVSEAGLATMVIPFAADLPTGVKAYNLTAISGTTVTSTDADAIAADKPVLVEAAKGDYNFTATDAAIAATANDAYTNGLLNGTYATSTVVGDGTIYVLANKNSVPGFYKLAEGEVVPAGKAYLKITASAPEFIGFGGTTGIDNVKAVEAKGEYFNLAGQRVAQPTKGLYIVNGKKVVLK